MTQFASHSGESLIDFSINNNSAAHSSTERKADAIIDTLTSTAPCFTKCRHVSIIVYFNRLAETVFQNFANREVLQTYIWSQ
ncbi:hypothetical protein D3C80_1828880 [compost metagenome]